jgi:hypothetical protein
MPLHMWPHSFKSILPSPCHAPPQLAHGGDGTHNPCSHSYEVKYDSGGECDKKELRNLWGISNGNLEPIHSMSTCLFALVVTFCLQYRNHTIGLFKTHTFMATWFWCLKPLSQVVGHPCLFGSKVTPCWACKWYT